MTEFFCWVKVFFLDKDAIERALYPSMLEIASLGSGSGGNASLVRSAHSLLLVDGGLSARQIVLRMEHLGVGVEQLDGVLLTHEHIDHVRGVEVLIKRYALPVYANAMTQSVLAEKWTSHASWRIFSQGSVFCVGELSVMAFCVPHDAVDPVGFVLESPRGTKLGFASDLGYVPTGVIDHLKGCHGLFVEANYDQNMLEQDTKRPWATKQRIASRHGHLSNEQTAALLAAVASDELQAVFLAHLSGDCNTPDQAKSIVNAYLSKEGIPCPSLRCVRQDMPTEWVKVSPRIAPMAVRTPEEEKALEGYHQQAVAEGFIGELFSL